MSPIRNRGSSQQRGFSLLLLLLVVVIAGASLFLAAAPVQPDSGRERTTADSRAAALAREALVAYALSGRSGKSAKGYPGGLPCPDTTNDGDSQGASCPKIDDDENIDDFHRGRVPVDTLDLGKGVFGGRDIWYVLDQDFLDGQTINPGNDATLTVNGAGGFAAVVIAAGDAVAGQNRPSTDASDYLEGENADDDTRFSNCATNTCNDRVLGVTRDSVLKPVREHVLGAVRDALESFYKTNDHYPYAAELGDSTGECVDELNYGMLPLEDGDCDASLDSLAAWVEANGWNQYLYYEVAEACDPDPDGANCVSGAPGLLTLENASDRAIVFATTGTAWASQSRAGPVPRDVDQYLDSAENAETPPDGIYDDPPNGPGENDHLRAVAAPEP